MKNSLEKLGQALGFTAALGLSQMGCNIPCKAEFKDKTYEQLVAEHYQKYEFKLDPEMLEEMKKIRGDFEGSISCYVYEDEGKIICKVPKGDACWR